MSLGSDGVLEVGRRDGSRIDLLFIRLQIGEQHHCSFRCFCWRGGGGVGGWMTGWERPARSDLAEVLL